MAGRDDESLLLSEHLTPVKVVDVETAGTTVTSIIGRIRPKHLAVFALCAAAAAATICATTSLAPSPKLISDTGLVLGLDEVVKREQKARVRKTNEALVLLKPHAATDKVIALVRDYLKKSKVKIIKEGRVSAEDIESKHLVDQHYGTLAARAMTLDPRTLYLKPEAAQLFAKTFNISWKDALNGSLVFNAAGACTKLKVSHDKLGELWHPLRLGKDKVKLGPGFYVGKVANMFVVNGFYMDMLKTFIVPGSSVYYLEVKWAAAQLPWKDFLLKLVGETDPKSALPGSMRHDIWKRWKTLGIPMEPNIRDNAVIASGSPFDGLSERVNWLNHDLMSDPFLQAMLASEIPLHRIKQWLSDSVIKFRGLPENIFDILEGLDSDACLERIREVELENFGGTHAKN